MAANRIWVDIETTGTDECDPHARVLEVAVVATTADAEYRELAHQSWVVQHDFPPAWLQHHNPYVYEMHHKSGLLYELPFGTPQARVEAELCRFVSYFGAPQPGREPVAGSSVHFDQRWLTKHLPRARALFSHRVFDASTLTQFARDLGVDVPKGDAAHRALADIRASIQLARDVASAVRTVRF